MPEEPRMLTRQQASSFYNRLRAWQAVVLQKSEENAGGVKSQFPAQLRPPLQTSWQ